MITCERLLISGSSLGRELRRRNPRRTQKKFGLLHAGVINVFPGVSNLKQVDVVGQPTMKFRHVAPYKSGATGRFIPISQSCWSSSQ